MSYQLEDIAQDGQFDVVVIGAGAAGMQAALFAAIDGARVLLVERTGYVGGTSALSAATTWIPNSHHVANGARDDSAEKVAGYLDRAVGERSQMAMRDAFIRNGAKAVAHIERNSELKFRMRAIHPDYISELEGSTLGGRALEPLPFDGRKLGSSFALVRPPIPEFTVLGGMMVDREDIGNLLTLTSSLKAFIYSTRIILRHAIDRLSHVRGTRLVMGNALIGRLLYSLNERNVAIAVNTEVEAIQRCTNGVDRVTLAQNGMRRTVRVKGGVILASGGFNRHPTRRAEMLPGVRQEWSPVAPGLTGTAQDLALALGAHFGTGGLSNAFWAPVSIRKRADGSVAAFPHFMMDRGKPGMIVVNQLGQRFLNESTSYHLFGIAMQDAHRKTSSIPAYLVTDADGLRRYGLGMVRPGGKRLKPYLDDGYLVQAPTLAELAYKLQVDPAGLQDSVRRINSYAETGVDPEFKRGTTDYQAFNGDAAQGGKNPTLGPIRQAPFYALRLYPGDIGAATGLVADTDARLLDRDGQPIPGLYACGNDMHSVMGGTYPGPGITLGPALAFAYLAGRHAAARANAPQRAPALPASPAGREG